MQLELDSTYHDVRIQVSCKAQGPTGVEVEALTSTAVATHTLYDVCKAVSRVIVLGEIKLISKTGGQWGKGGFHQTRAPALSHPWPSQVRRWDATGAKGKMSSAFNIITF